ncbi:Dynein regulatory complex subunit 5 [Phytophthora citrophthora]|uniref:Dynein regulatory complex subunit 5 n=1 Tax=Phytophthora citrophthora TaxID=4793 RepID=A0AAD9GWT5_9STRA|nr:Dynein regulatory complex subunit 5 [Phytophthora citrophthora]
MVSASTVGATTDVCALSDQVKKYRARVVQNVHEADSDGKAAGSSSVIPSLLLMCLKIISDRFCLQPKAQNVPRQFLPEVMARLPLDLDACVTAPNVTDENYWKRRCLSKTQWKNSRISDHGLTWKQLFLEKHLQDLLEAFDPSVDDHDHLMAVVKASSEFIFTLEIDQLLSHLDLNEICAQLRNLTKLRVTYGVKQIGMKYERMLFGMKISDATNLSHIIKTSTSLTTLWLPSNLLDDDLLRMLMTGLVKNSSITSLDLSHNKLTNHGARLLSKLLGPESVITTLKLCDNQIHAEGGRYLSRGLKYNSSLVELDLRLNRLTDDGGRMLLDGLVEHTSLTNLNLSSNMLGKESAEALAEILSDSLTSLRSIDLSSNSLSESDGDVLLQGLHQNSTVIALDLRQNTQIPADADCIVKIAQKIRQNEVNMKTPSSTAEDATST